MLWLNEHAPDLSKFKSGNNWKYQSIKTKLLNKKEKTLLNKRKLSRKEKKNTQSVRKMKNTKVLNKKLPVLIKTTKVVNKSELPDCERNKTVD